ncbi:protein of unknown function DUF309 [Desulfurobacterium thermolithotrophum DSM 11699]|uniref:DUF309 domain-containing protein n=1 Tax=Desulfurobacterium thermolithotrophum (strain DSM 11699 / BSA) TaxID=868864 RepID=F0S0W7_DESTD|nr:DUF309 domain-containing protein [Desulfurobacterium thermolithotrophum]ADY72771.1 protein of unknown function DUF309 [Desulfurobacterium thermolithotrophum DSM 11699]
MDIIEIRNWFAQNLCNYLRNKEKKSLEKLLTVIEVVENGSSKTKKDIAESISLEFSLVVRKNEKLLLNQEELDSFTKEYLTKKVKAYKNFLNSLNGFEPVDSDIERNVRMARKLFDAGLYFEVHELLEELWMVEFGKYREFLQALIQIGVAYYHITNYNTRGFEHLIKNAKKLLEPYSGVLFSVNVDLLKEEELSNQTSDKVIKF